MVRRIRIFAVCIFIILPLLISFPVFAAEDDEYIEIYSAVDLAAVSGNPDLNYRLMSDINMEDIIWIPVPFNGIFDGNNHIIFNLTLDKFAEQASTAIDGNHKEYETYFASLFSECNSAVIKNLTLINVKSDLNVAKHCFVAGIVGKATDVNIINCHVTGRFFLESNRTMCGIGGLVGFGTGYVTDSSAVVTMSIINHKPTTEEFMGGIWSCGYPDIENCTTVTDMYATTLGYTHNGGIIGMHHIHENGLVYNGYIRNCTSDCSLFLFGHSKHPHQHNGPIAGERLNRYVQISNNTVIEYNLNKTRDYDLILRPCMCENPEYAQEVTEYTCTEYGYTTYTCESCGYSYTDNYVLPAHRQGEFVTVREPSYEQEGLIEQRCSMCQELLYSKSIPKLIYAESINLNYESIKIDYKSTRQLSAALSPSNAENTNVVWSSSDETIVTVDQNGTIYGVKKGEAVIACASQDGNTVAECTVKVTYSFRQWLIIILLFGWLWY